MISRYFDDIKRVIESFDYIVERIQIQEKTYSEERGYIDGFILFTDESHLEFAEVKDMETVAKVKYRYHYMDSDNSTIFRYDNAKHHKESKRFLITNITTMPLLKVLNRFYLIF